MLIHGIMLAFSQIKRCVVLQGTQVLLLFKIMAQTDSGLKEFEFAYVSVLEQYTGRRVPGMHIMHILIILACSDYCAYSDHFHD